MAVFVSNLSTQGQARIVDIDAELRAAKTVAFATVDSYTDSTITFKQMAVSAPDRLFVSRLKTFDKAFIGKQETGGLPPENSDVIVVVDSNNYVSLFARRVSDKPGVHFWSPIYTGSDCIFKYNKFFYRDSLPKEEYDGERPPWDSSAYFFDFRQSSGKVSISSLRFHYNYRCDVYITGDIRKDRNRLIFVPVITDSEFYVIKNGSEFESMIGKRIVAFGKLSLSSFYIEEFKPIK